MTDPVGNLYPGCSDDVFINSSVADFAVNMESGLCLVVESSKLFTVYFINNHTGDKTSSDE